jgi:hypothetical protein
MLSELAPDVGFSNTSVHGWAAATTDDGHLSRLEATLAPELAREGDALEVSVTEGCGTVEVRVSGPSAELRLLFDRADLDPAYVRHVVRGMVKRYRASFGHRPHKRGLSGRE